MNEQIHAPQRAWQTGKRASRQRNRQACRQENKHRQTMHHSSLENLSLPRRQRVFDTQLVPDGDPLPIWTKLPLDNKLPIVPAPRGCYTLYTTKVGQPKYIHKQHYDFDLDYPLYARPGEYDSLHDPFLRNYFGKPRTKQLLVHNDLITKDGKVKCDIKEFNQYRSYLRYRSVTELSLQRKSERGEESSWLGRPQKTEPPRARPALHHSTTSSDRDADSTAELAAIYGSDVSLVQRLRMREKTLMKRMAERERQRQKEYERRVKDSWQSRKLRQQRLLEREEEIERKAREERLRQILQREKILAKQRERMIAKLGRSIDGLDTVAHQDRKEKRVKKKGKEQEEEESGHYSSGDGDQEYASDNA